MDDRSPLQLKSTVIIGQGEKGFDSAAKVLENSADDLHRAKDTKAGLRLVQKLSPDLAIIQPDIKSTETLQLIHRISRTSNKTRIVAVDDQRDSQHVRALFRAGCYDCVPSPLSAEDMTSLLDGIHQEQVRDADDNGRFFCEDCPPDLPIVGTSGAMSESLRTIRLIAESRCNPVLILGETGAGKELAARAVHAWRFGNDADFVPVNCAALTANLLESELFGHVKGAFTGADRDKAGLLEVAGSGTILLDEISEMPLNLQAKILRVLQEKKFRKVGGAKEIPCNATIVATSNRELKAEADANRFRRDLYYRLAVFPVRLHPLRHEDRRDDIPLLIEYMLTHLDIGIPASQREISKTALDKMLTHAWPGNVRELRNAMERALILSRGETIEPEHIFFETDAYTAPAIAPSSEESKPAEKTEVKTPPSKEDFSLETAEREFILRALKETGWQRTRAATLLGITRATLHAKLKRYDIQPPESSRCSKLVSAK